MRFHRRADRILLAQGKHFEIALEKRGVVDLGKADQFEQGSLRETFRCPSIFFAKKLDRQRLVHCSYKQYLLVPPRPISMCLI